MKKYLPIEKILFPITTMRDKKNKPFSEWIMYFEVSFWICFFLGLGILYIYLNVN